jgi:hypothetical protein
MLAHFASGMSIFSIRLHFGIEVGDLLALGLVRSRDDFSQHIGMAA